ncbi:MULTISPECIES: S8 family serine peptidase [unclassified Mycolicibacterium]|uniref:Cell wall-associated protease n=3 Tax=unclassified Mycolicibacterium TaxID=2636767 RepID=A0A1S6GKT3_9MYCO|nr:MULTISPECIES: S8 family serine peptidase [unclassified Mycolicibacterium]AQS22452.1 Cell wall-associated protease precursor [Mycolicibacterium sp. CBMA 213]
MMLKRVAAASGAAALLAANILAAPAAMAIAPPVIDPGALPAPGTPGPTEQMRQTQACSTPVVIADPDVTQPPPGNTMLNIAQAWQYSTGAGVLVAIVDTGVAPNPRLNVSAGGDYVQGLPNGGLTDCDNHGTVVASIIGAAPANPANRPPVKPIGVGAPPPPPPVPANPAPTSAPPPPPPAQTVTVTAPPPPAPAPPPPPPPGGDAPANGPADPNCAPPQCAPLVPGPAPGGPDGMVGVAPDATMVSIRQSSVAFAPEHSSGEDADQHRKAGDVLSLAKAIRTAADLGAKVINVSLAACINAAVPVNQDALGAAVRYAAVDKDAVIVAAAGNRGDLYQRDCGQNPAFNPLNTKDPRDWDGVRTIVSPAEFSDYVLSVGAVTPEGLPMPDSINGPWVGVAAPGSRIMGLSATNGAAVNANPAQNSPGNGNGIWGTSFSAAYVSGVAALVRARFPQLTSHQVIRRIMETAHNPAHGVDNQVGNGVVDPVAALTWDVAAGDPRPVEHLSDKLFVPPPKPGPDLRPRNTALLGAAGVAVVAGLVAAVIVIRRRLSS